MQFLKSLFRSGPAVDDVDVVTTSAALADAKAQVVDCRSEREWRSGHIAGSRLMPLGSIGNRMHELDKEQPVIVVCRSGHRSAIAARQLASAGFSDVKSMNGGINAWVRSGKPLET